MLTGIARAKINLYLHVTGRRPDGYHLLDSLVVFTDFGDELTVEHDDDLSLEICGPFSSNIAPANENLVLKAARLLQSNLAGKPGARIKLAKNLPVAAGIGGGSADAALTLHLLNELWGLRISLRQLAELGLSLGADVPVCLHGKPTVMSGIGDQLSDIISIPKIYIILVNLKIQVSTGDVFRRLHIRETAASGFAIEDDNVPDFFSALRGTRNDLQAPAVEIVPEIEAVITEIAGQKGCQIARISGSGATAFGLFENPVSAQNAAENIQLRRPDWWVQATTVAQ